MGQVKVVVMVPHRGHACRLIIAACSTPSMVSPWAPMHLPFWIARVSVAVCIVYEVASTTLTLVVAG